MKRITEYIGEGMLGDAFNQVKNSIKLAVKGSLYAGEIVKKYRNDYDNDPSLLDGKTVETFIDELKEKLIEVCKECNCPDNMKHVNDEINKQMIACWKADGHSLSEPLADFILYHRKRTGRS